MEIRREAEFVAAAIGRVLSSDAASPGGVDNDDEERPQQQDLCSGVGQLPVFHPPAHFLAISLGAQDGVLPEFSPNRCGCLDYGS